MVIYSLTLESDTGKFPCVDGGLCSLFLGYPRMVSSIIEKGLKEEVYVIGLSKASNFIKPSGLIFAMRVDFTMGCNEYIGTHPNRLDSRIYSNCLSAKNRLCPYINLRREDSNSYKNVLLSRNFYYLGWQAEFLPSRFSNYIKATSGYKIIDDKDSNKLLVEYFKNEYEKFKGKSNQAMNKVECSNH